MNLRHFRFITLLAASALPGLAGTIYYQNNLVSDIPGLATITDSNLVNPWGLAASAGSPWWVSDNKTGVATLYNGNTGVAVPLVVSIPPPAGQSFTSAPDGQVFNGTTDFLIGNTKANFIFATEDGTISAWNQGAGTSAVLKVDNSAMGAVYKGLAIGNNGSGNFLYAANFNSGNIDVFDGTFTKATLSANAFKDPGIPSGYAPFNVQNLNGKLYVTYALQDALKHDDVSGPGNGFVDVYDTNGNLIKRLISNGALDSPWGLALAPSNFGIFSGDLLIGNFGDGTINAFDATTGNLLGDLQDQNGKAITIQGLWGLGFGNGAAAGPANSLFFTAGIPGGDTVESHGLFGDIVAAPEPGAVWMALIGLAGLTALGRKRRYQNR